MRTMKEVCQFLAWCPRALFDPEDPDRDLAWFMVIIVVVVVSCTIVNVWAAGR